MQINTNKITFNEETVTRTAETSYRQNARVRSSRKADPSQQSRNEKKGRNQSAMLPTLDNNRYPSQQRIRDMLTLEDSGANNGGGTLHYVAAQRRQLREAIQMQQPQTNRFYDDSIQGALDPKNAFYSDNIIGDKKSEIASRHRRRQMQKETTPMVSSRKMSYQVSPRGGLNQVPSKVSLVTESQNNHSFKTPMSVRTATNQGLRQSHSPTNNQNSSSMQSFARELKSITKYLDSREMQIRTELEGTQKLDVKLEQNKLLEELYRQVIASVRVKLPQATQALGDIFKRTMDGLKECFVEQEKNFVKKVEIRNKKIDSLKYELDELNQNYYNFKTNSTIDAYFKKYGDDVIARTGRREKDYLKDLVKTVDEFLGENKESMDGQKLTDERNKTKDMEPSGVDALLVGLQMQNKGQEIPQITENPLTSVDADKPSVMVDFKKALNTEAIEVRGLIERHVKKQMGLLKPTVDSEAQTLTYKRLQETIVDKTRSRIEAEEKIRAEERGNIKIARLDKDIESLQEKNKQLKDKMYDRQRKMTENSSGEFLEDIKSKIIYFFKKKLSKKNQNILVEFADNIQDIVNAEVPDGADELTFKNSQTRRSSTIMQQITKEDSEASRRRLANKFEHTMTSNMRRSNMSGEDMEKLVKQHSVASRAMSDHGSALLDINKSFDSIQQVVPEESDQELNDKPIDIPDDILSQRLSANASDDDQQILDLKKEVDKANRTVAMHLETIEKLKSGMIELGRQVKTSAQPESNEEQPVVVPSTASVKEPVAVPGTASVEENKETLDSGPLKKIASPRSTAKATRSKSPAKSKAVKGKKGASVAPKQKESQPQQSDQALAPSEKLVAGEAVSNITPSSVVVAEKDNRKELLDHLKDVKKVTKKLQGFQSQDQLAMAEKKSDQAIAKLNRVSASTEVVNQIMKLNSDEPEKQSTALGLFTRAFKLCESINSTQATLKKVRQGCEMHKLIEAINKFLTNSQKKGKALPEKDLILAQLAKLEQVNEIVDQLPTNQEITGVTTIDKDASEIENELQEFLSQKFVKPPQEPVIIKEEVIVEVIKEVIKGVPVIETQEKSAQQSNKSSKRAVEDSIRGITMVRNQIRESHSLILNSQDQQQTAQDDVIVKKVQRLMSHMDEALQWLTQQQLIDGGEMAKVDIATESEYPMNGSMRGDQHVGNALEELISDTSKSTPAILEREKALRQHNSRNFEATEWSQSGSNAPRTPQLPLTPLSTTTNPKEVIEQMNEFIKSENKRDKMALSQLSKRKQSEQLQKQSEKMIKVRHDAQIYLDEQDIGMVKEDTAREADTSGFSSQINQPNQAQQQRNISNTSLGRIGEEVNDGQPDTADAGTSNQNRELTPPLDRSSRVEVFRRTPSQLKVTHVNEDDQPQFTKKFNQATANDQITQAQMVNGATQIGEHSLKRIHESPDPDMKTPSIVQTVQSHYTQSGHVVVKGKSYSSIEDQKIKGLTILGKHIRGSPKAGEHQDRKQLLDEIWHMDKTQTFSSVNDTARFRGENALKSPHIQILDKLALQTKKENNKDLAHNLRQSGAAETDYLKTASHFGADPNRNELRTINIGLVTNESKNIGHNTVDFKNNLAKTVAVDKKQTIKNKSNKNQGINSNIRINNDLIATGKNFLDSHDSSVMGGQDAAGHVDEGNSIQPFDALSPTSPNSPSLQITRKPFTKHVKVEESGQFHIVSGDAAQQWSSQPAFPLNSVLMLTQETQTENRSLIKHLLTLINETIMKQLEEQSIRMTNEDFQEHVNQFTKAIPTVYDSIKKKSDTFFVEQKHSLSPSISQTSLQQIQQYQHQQYDIAPQQDVDMVKGLNMSNSNKDFINLIQSQPVNDEYHINLNNQDMLQVYGNKGNHSRGHSSLQPSASTKVLHQNPSQKRIKHYVDTNKQQQPQQQVRQQEPTQFLSVGDYSKYGKHTLELSQEVRTRVNLHQIGSMGGGFGGRVVKTKSLV